MSERNQTTRRRNQTKVLTTLLWRLQELISFTVSHLQTHKCAGLTPQQLSRVLQSFLQTVTPGPQDAYTAPLLEVSEIKVWMDFLKGVLLVLKVMDVSQSVVSVPWKPNHSLQSPEHFYSQREKSQELQEIKKQRKEKYRDELCRTW